jgi:hypothetical protein
MTQPSESLEIRVAWYIGALSVVLAAIALMPTLPLRALAAAAGAAATVIVSPFYLRRASAFSSAVVTVLAWLCSGTVVLSLSGLAWETGISWSRAGEAGKPSAWLFTTSALCFGVGVLATGRLIVREGRRLGSLDGRAYLVASLLPALSFAGFLVVALCPVGGDPRIAVAHNLASWAALGSFWCGMALSPLLRGLPRPLRYYSALAAVVVVGAWLPNGLYFMRLVTERPVSMLAMELVVFPLCFLWFCWLAWEWSVAVPLRGWVVDQGRVDPQVVVGGAPEEL